MDLSDATSEQNAVTSDYQDIVFTKVYVCYRGNRGPWEPLLIKQGTQKVERKGPRNWYSTAYGDINGRDVRVVFTVEPSNSGNEVSKIFLGINDDTEFRIVESDNSIRINETNAPRYSITASSTGETDHWPSRLPDLGAYFIKGGFDIQLIKSP